MKKIWRGLSLRFKVLLPFVVIMFLIMLVILFKVLPSIKEDIINARKNNIKNIVNSQITIIQNIYNKYQNNELTEEEARKFALEIVESVRHGDNGKDYLWINDFQPVLLMHPYVKDLIGKDLSKYKDRKGKFMFNEFVKTCRTTEGEGFVDYYWQYEDDKDRIVKKISFVKAFKPWNWIIGTGVYIEDINEQFSKSRITILGMIIFSSVILFLVLFFFVKFVFKPLNNNIKIIEHMARGDLSIEIKVSGNDEISKLTAAMYKMKTEISKIIRNILQLTETLEGSAKEISSTAESLSSNANEQASNVEEISSTMEEINAAVAQNSDNSQTTNQIAQDSARLAKEGNEAVKETVESINKISEKIILVQEIAEQTNLLALNASIEAARAGRHGKGFAVVAGEVRKLSQKSQFATQEITSLAKKSVTVAVRAGEQLDEIVSSIGKTAQLVQSISSSSGQQSAGIEQVSNSMTQLSDLTQGTAASSEELASASEMMKENSINLNQAVTYFKLEAGEKKIDVNAEKQ